MPVTAPAETVAVPDVTAFIPPELRDYEAQTLRAFGLLKKVRADLVRWGELLSAGFLTVEADGTDAQVSRCSLFLENHLDELDRTLPPFDGKAGLIASFRAIVADLGPRTGRMPRRRMDTSAS